MDTKTRTGPVTPQGVETPDCRLPLPGANPAVALEPLPGPSETIAHRARPARPMASALPGRAHFAPWNGVILGLASADAGQRAASMASLRRRLFAAFERRDVRARLETHAIRGEDARARAAALTERQVAAVIAALDIRPEKWGPFLPPSRIEIFAQTLSSVLRLPQAVLVAIVCEPIERPSDWARG